MRKDYDLSKAERGKFYRKVDTANPVINDTDEPLGEKFADELAILESNLARIKTLKIHLAELDITAQKQIAHRIADAGKELDELALTK